MQLTLHATRQTPHGASRLVPAMSAWSVKTRCAPSRHCKDARVYGHTTTTAMHDNEYPLPPWVGFPSSAARQPTRCPSTERYVFGKFPARFFQRRLFFGTDYSNCRDVEHGKSAQGCDTHGRIRQVHFNRGVHHKEDPEVCPEPPSIRNRLSADFETVAVWDHHPWTRPRKM